MHIRFNLSKKILAWYDNNRRNLPWRVGKYSKNKLYYRVLSEFMLQQTQVKTVIPYFKKFTKKFKTLKDLSEANQKSVLKLWEGLGYYRRARNLHSTSKVLVKKYKNKLPQKIEEIMKLPGVGTYTANALLGLIRDEPRIAIDGNVKRIISRLLNEKDNNIDFNKFVLINKNNLFFSGRNSDFLEAIMEFGAIICKPKDPLCFQCDLRKNCNYFNSIKKVNNIKQMNKKKKYLDIFCYLNNRKQIALTKKHDQSFLNQFNLPKIQDRCNEKNKDWKFLKNYQNSISNKQLNINLYYKFCDRIPRNFFWFSIYNNSEFVPSFTKKIFKQIESLF
jgi:A/G-specific adenine glycosylase